MTAALTELVLNRYQPVNIQDNSYRLRRHRDLIEALQSLTTLTARRR